MIRIYNKFYSFSVILLSLLSNIVSANAVQLETKAAVNDEVKTKIEVNSNVKIKAESNARVKTQDELDEVKVQLVAKGGISGKTIKGPDKYLIKIKIANELNTIKNTPESINAENLDLLSFESEIQDDASVTKPKDF